MSHLFSPLTVRGLTLRNRIFVSPMCQYSSVEGAPTDWHFVHLGSRAVGGAGLVMVEATAVAPEGRISPGDSGIWNDSQAEAFVRITKFLKENGAAPAIQLAHAGRKASTDVPWNGGAPLIDHPLAWQPMAPSAIPFDGKSAVPRQMSIADIDAVVQQFSAAARRALAAGFEAVEIHAAHGYLLHEFLSPISNHRDDEYGGSLENRMRLPLRVAAAVREAWPAEKPAFIRISATDWAPAGEGWDLAQSVEFCKRLNDIGIDLIDCSSGGNLPAAKIPVGPDFQVPFAEAIRKEAKILTGAVGLITDPSDAERILTSERADAILIGRAMLADPYWPLHAASKLGAEIEWPKQYARAKR
jgi:2,4-dienoyl-CoA reductase-like NADH-dependent reductase (Old Yellow Enzyme family)